MNTNDLQLFSLASSRPFAERVSKALSVALSPHEERSFGDGEHKTRPLVSVRRRDVYVIQSLYGDRSLNGNERQSVNDKLCRLLFFIGALKDAGAASVSAVVPYLCYARKDRRTKSRDPLTTRYVATLFEAIGTDRVLVLEAHNLAAFQNAFRCQAEHLYADDHFAAHFTEHPDKQNIVVVSPDVGGVKRAERFRDHFSRRFKIPVTSAFIEKYRSKDVVSGGALVGEVDGKTVIIFDDMIGSGNTIMRAVNACHNSGARHIYAAAAHGLFNGNADETLDNPLLEHILVSDSIAPDRLRNERVKAKLTIIDTAPLFAEAIRRLHSGGSISELLGME